MLLKCREDPDGRHLGVRFESGILDGCRDVERHFRQWAIVVIATDEISDAAVIDAEILVVIESDLQVGVVFKDVVDVAPNTYAVVGELVRHHHDAPNFVRLGVGLIDIGGEDGKLHHAVLAELNGAPSWNSPRPSSVIMSFLGRLSFVAWMAVDSGSMAFWSCGLPLLQAANATAIAKNNAFVFIIRCFLLGKDTDFLKNAYFCVMLTIKIV